MGINERLLDFIEKSPTAFHAVSEIAARLTAQGFRRINEGEVWKIERGGDYFVTRNDSSIIAFRVGGQAEIPAYTKLSATPVRHSRSSTILP